jgi:hypothetical protein
MHTVAGYPPLVRLSSVSSSSGSSSTHRSWHDQVKDYHTYIKQSYCETSQHPSLQSLRQQP